MSQSQTPLVDWLIQACETRGLSWAEASRRAGLSQGTISAIVRGTQPGLEICKGLAGFFGVPLEDVLRMAGHMTPVPAPALAPGAGGAGAGGGGPAAAGSSCRDQGLARRARRHPGRTRSDGPLISPRRGAGRIPYPRSVARLTPAHPRWHIQIRRLSA